MLSLVQSAMFTFLRRSPSRVWSTLLVVPALAGCGAPHASGVAVEPVAPVRAPPLAPVERAPVPPPSVAPASDASADSVVTLIAKPGLWPLDVESARRVLQALGPVSREQPTENELALVGGPHGALGRF